MLLIANLLLFPVSFLMFICNLSLHRKKRDFRDSLPLATLNGCAQSIFSAENETMIERFQSERFTGEQVKVNRFTGDHYLNTNLYDNKNILLCFCHFCSVAGNKPVCFAYSVNQSHVP